MATIVTSTELQNLQPGDRITYRAVDWLIEDYSFYQGPQAYYTDEWLLKSKGGSEYYLLREYDPEKSSHPVTWYVASEVTNARLFLPNSQEDIVPELWDDIYSEATPYPELLLFYKTYYFKSQTKSNYQLDGQTKRRVTWDYWDKDYQTNLALEAFPQHQLTIYLTKVVQPEEFSNLTRDFGRKWHNNLNWVDNLGEMTIAFFIFLTGLLLLFFG